MKIKILCHTFYPADMFAINSLSSVLSIISILQTQWKFMLSHNKAYLRFKFIPSVVSGYFVEPVRQTAVNRNKK